MTHAMELITPVVLHQSTAGEHVGGVALHHAHPTHDLHKLLHNRLQWGVCADNEFTLTTQQSAKLTKDERVQKGGLQLTTQCTLSGLIPDIKKQLTVARLNRRLNGVHEMGQKSRNGGKQLWLEAV